MQTNKTTLHFRGNEGHGVGRVMEGEEEVTPLYFSENKHREYHIFIKAYQIRI